MITQRELQELVNFRGKGQVFSLYLNVDPAQRPKEKCKLILKGLLEEARGTASSRDINRVKRFFDFEYDWQARGLAAFSAHKDDFWRAYPLALPVEDQFFVADKPYVKPLSDLLDEHAPYAVVLVGREQARFFLVHLGEIEERSHTFEEVRRLKRGGGSAATGVRGGVRGARHEQEVALRNLKQAAELTADFFQDNDCPALLLAGTEVNLAQLRALLPRAVQEHVVGEIPLEMTAAAAEVLTRTMELQERVEREEEEALVERLITAAGKGGAAALGLDDTLFALQQGRVYNLVVTADFQAPGFACPECGRITTQALQKCPLCSGQMYRVDDAVELAVRQAMELGSKVEVVRGEAAEKLAEVGNIGAVLRY